MPKKLSFICNIDTGSDPKSYCVGKENPKWDLTCFSCESRCWFSGKSPVS